MSGRPIPPLSLGMVSLELLNLGCEAFQMKPVHSVRYVEKNEGGSLIGTVCSKYKI